MHNVNDNKNVIKDERVNKMNYYLDIATAVAMRGTCLRRNYGAVIVNNDKIVSTGYTGAPRGRKNCCDLGYCVRNENNIPRGERYELCRSVHSEMNAIIHASHEDMIGATLYLVGKEKGTGDYVVDADCCAMCKRAIINAGIKTVVIRDNRNSYRVIDTRYWVDNDDSIDCKRGY